MQRELSELGNMAVFHGLNEPSRDSDVEPCLLGLSSVGFEPSVHVVTAFPFMFTGHGGCDHKWRAKT